METYTQCTIHGIFGFILFITSITGLGPLNVETVKDGWRLTVSKSINIYGKLLVLCLCVLTTFAVITTYDLRPRPFHLETTSDRILAVLTLTMALPAGLVASFTGMERMRHLINYLAQLEKINNELKEYYKQAIRNERKITLCTICLLILGNLTIFTEYGVFVKYVVSHNYEVTLQCMYIFYYILVEYVQLISIQFFFTASSVLSSFKLLNNYLNSLYMNHNGVYTVDKPPKAIADSIRRVRFQYFSLSDVMCSLNDTHGPMLVQLLMVYLVNLTVTPYKILNMLLNGTSIDYSTVAVQFLCLTLHISNLVIVVEPCQRTHNEVYKTKTLISKLMRCKSHSKDTLSSELQLFYANLMTQDITYTPLSMFTIDRTLIMPLLGTVSTYLVIVLTL